MLNLIISRTGYGKTTYIKSKIKELVEQNEQLVLIIPEQISFESERDILREVGAKNLKNVTVMSFTRLCSIFFAQYGGREKPYIDTVGKTALMAQVLKSNENKLDLFKKASKTSQFCEMMLKLHNNLKKISVTPEDLFSCASAEKGLLSGKLSESSLILSEYEKELNKEYFDPLDDLSVVTERLDENPFFENKIVFIDSFTGFTTQQIKLIEKIMKSAKQTYISLGFDGVYSTNGLSCFSNMAKTALQLKQLAKDNGVQVGDDIIFTKNHRFKNDELDFLEKNIFADDKNVYDESVENIFVTSVKNIYEEVEYVAKTIIDLTRKQGLRYREISVISRDANAYNQVINEVFEKYEIPLFVDDREGVENLNLFKLVYFALQAVCKKFDNESVISLVKTGLAGVSDTEAELFELYTYVWRVNKKDFFEEFKLPIDSFITGDDEYKETITKTIEETRQKIIAPLEKFKKQKGKTIKSFVTAIYQLIEDYDCGVTLKKQAEKLKENGYLRLSESTVRSYDIMIHILDQLYLSLGETQVDTKGFFDIFNSAVALLDVGSLPQGIDAVAVGSAERMRPKSPRVTFIIGANEGVFPSASSGKGLFADSELLTLKEKGINLPFFDVDTAVDEQYLAYCAVCSPSEKLFISYPEFSLSGEQKAPSVIVDNILDIFEKLQVVKYDNTEIRSAEDAIKAFAISGATDVEIAQYFNENNNIKFENLMQSRTDKISKISQQTAKELYGDTIYSSASKVEAYNKCSFYYFCQYGLEAKVLKQAKIDALSRGSLVHFILEKMLNTYSVDEFFALSQMQIFEKIKEFADEFWNKNSSAVNQTLVEKYRFSKLCEMVEELVLRVYEELKQSEFNVVKNELAFGGEEPDIKALEVDFEDGKIALIGKIDRVDKSVKNGKQILRIIDYKTGNKKLDFADLIYGQNLQMPIYMKAVIDNGKDEFGECLPGGMFYFAARESVAKMSKNSTDEEIVAERLKSVKMDGTFLGEEDVYTAIEPDGKGYYSPVKVNKDNTLSKNAPYYTFEQYKILSDYLELKLKQTAKGILSGKINPEPLDGVKTKACDYCDYGDVCMFKGEHQQIMKMKSDEVFMFMHDALEKEKEAENGI